MEFPGNSHNVVGDNKPKSPVKKKEPKVVTKVVTGEVIKRKKPLGRRFKEVFIHGELKNVAGYVATDVLLPAFRNLVVDSITKGIEQMMYGDTPRRRTPAYRDPRASRISYNSASSPIGRAAPAARSRSTTDRYVLDDVILADRDEAITVLEQMTEIADRYEIVSVADLYELVGLPSTHVDHNWGWSGLHDVSVRQVRQGYLIDLPEAEPLN